VVSVTTISGIHRIYGTPHIGRRAAENFLHAIRFTHEVGRPINTHITINFHVLDIDNFRAGDIFTELKARIARWWAYQRKKNSSLRTLVGVHSHSNPNGSRHVHWLTHIPDHLRADFELTVDARLRKILGIASLPPTALHIGPVGAPGMLAKYVLRGIDPAYADYLHIRHEDEGLVMGRRTGVSRAISLAARKKADWTRRQSPRRWRAATRH
jgi:hypothetical protein